MKAIKYLIAGAFFAAVSTTAVAQGVGRDAQLEAIRNEIKANPNDPNAAKDLVKNYTKEFKKDADGKPVLLECNPRVQGTMVMSAMAGANIIAAAVRDCLQLPSEPMQIDWNTRLIRYWGAIGVNEAGVVKI